MTPAFSRPFTPRDAPLWITVLLAVLSLPYGLVVRGRNFLYDLNLLPARELPIRAVCIGNLTTGGTGKTPAVAWVARFFKAKGIPAAILRRGYKRGKGKGPSDESLLLMEQVPEVQVIENPDRVAAAKEAAGRGAELVILDDGFQHRRAKRDLDLVLVDAADPFGGGHILPWGLLREPVQGLARADLLILTRCDQVSESTLEQLEIRLKALKPEALVVRAAHAPCRLFKAGDGSLLDLKLLVGKKVRAFAGIARPQAFFRTLEDLGAHVERRIEFPDHHDYKAEEATALLKQSGMTWITTEKDWVKIRQLVPEIQDLWVLGIDLEILRGGDHLEKILATMLSKKRDQG